MRQYDLRNLVVHPGNSTDHDVVVEVTPELAGWDYISFQLRRLTADRSWKHLHGRALSDSDKIRIELIR